MADLKTNVLYYGYDLETLRQPLVEMLHGKQPELPGIVFGFAKAPRLRKRGKQMALSESGDN